MTRERWEQILFAHVGDEVVQDMLNEYVLELESENEKLRRLVSRLSSYGGCCFIVDGGTLARKNGKSLPCLRLTDENEKLRDLALNCYRMAKAHCTAKDCRTRCSHWPECSEHDSLRHAEPCELAVLACELGIEVE